MKKLLLCTAIAGQAFLAAAAERDTINIVGSSTVYPFAIIVAETFGKETSFKTPKIESTGSGGGMKLFCAGVGTNTPDITNASRRMKKSEYDLCQENGVTEITEVLVGYDGIAFANATAAPQFDLSVKDIYLALAKNIPNPDGTETFIANPYKTWKEVNGTLPEVKIEVLGPPKTSGTRDAFAELAMEGGCTKFDWVKALAKSDKNKYKDVCHSMREDGAYIEAGENDNLIVQKLESNPDALGIFGYSFLEENSSKVKGSTVDGHKPEFETIASGEYAVSRPLYFYVKNAHVGKIPGLKEYVDTFTSEDAFGSEGYLIDRGLIPLDDAKRTEVMDAAKNLTPLQL